jgi:hypothetical protein
LDPSEKSTRLLPKGPRDLDEVVDADITFPALDPANIGGVQIRAACQLFLRPAPYGSQPPNRIADPSSI